MSYKLRYLPLAKEDLINIVDYIQNTILSPIAAENTVSRIEKAILKRLENPESFAVWPSSKERKHPSRRINVKNYTVWYVVVDDVMEISGRDEKRLL
ncbi:type II toxin-antitoxin system RelE/ParE family toxin [bacterium]|nr:type II toxin-antitoxin system RelE/ParE family toxin [bacterium]